MDQAVSAATISPSEAEPIQFEKVMNIHREMLDLLTFTKRIKDDNICKAMTIISTPRQEGRINFHRMYFI